MPNRPAPTPDDFTRLDHSVEHLLSGLDWRGCELHVGQYCGPWTASTAGHQRASFHLVLHGHCHLHRPGHPSVALGPRDGVFLLQDQAHHLSPDPTPARPQHSPHPSPVMQRLGQGTDSESTGLACGFFEFKGAYSHLLIATLPAQLVLRAGSAPAPQLDALFTLLLSEARQASGGESPVTRRLVELIFFQVLRQHAHSQATQGLWSMVSEPALMPLLEAMMRQPGLDWTADSMARHVHMSRARFFRVFNQACGQSPAQFLAGLRMQLAARQLEQGANLARTAQSVGYQSYAAFSRAFKKVIGQHPVGFQRGEPSLRDA